MSLPSQLGDAPGQLVHNRRHPVILERLREGHEVG